jgi:hypothetical protein
LAIAVIDLGSGPPHRAGGCSRPVRSFRSIIHCFRSRFERGGIRP